MTYRYSFVHLDQERSLLRSGVMSLKHYWRRSGGRWTKLKRLIVEHRGAHCEKCSASGVTLEAHEVWKHISASKTGIELKEIRQVRDYCRKHPIQSTRHPRVLVRALVDIRLLCHECHRAEPSWDYYRDFIMESHYSGFDELPKFRTFAEWEAAMQDDADLRNEDEKYYCLSGVDNPSI